MTEFAARIDKARAAIAASGVDALCLSLGSDLPYLTGYAAMMSERLTMLVLPVDGDAVLVVPELEAPRVDTSHGIFGLRPWGETEDPVAVVDRLLGGADVVAIGEETWSTFLLGLQQRDEHRTWIGAGAMMSGLRVIKSDAEISALRTAAAVADGVQMALRSQQWSGRSERDVSNEIRDRLIRGGHESAKFAIVGSGPNGASPHHEASSRVIQRGDAVVCDIGGHQDGYASDTTRMFVVGEPPSGFDDAFEVLREAQQAAVEHVRPGVTAESVDQAARGVIADAGYGEYFIHRTGHGIGMDTHEHPYIVEGNETVLEPGMAFSIEPGIYLPGEWGMRLEDIVVVTDGGTERLNTTDRSYTVVD